MQDKKNTITNILAIIMAVGGAANSYFESLSGDINWLTLGSAIVMAVISYLTGKNKDGKKKSV